MAAAVSTAIAANATQTQSAGRKPAVTPSGVPRWPWAENTAPAIATAKTVPKRWNIALMPDALPISSGATALSTAVGTVGRAIETPMPATSSAAASSIQVVLGALCAAAQVKPTDCRTNPVTI